MTQLSVILGVTNLSVGALIILVSIPLYLRQVAQNEFYGMRFREAYISDEAWYAINRYGAGWMMVWSLGLMAFGVYLFCVPVAEGSFLCWLGLLVPLVLLVPAFQTWLYARRFKSH